MLSSQIREQLKNVKDTHEKMQNALHQEEKERNKGGKALLEARGDDINEHVRIVELTAKHIEECESLEKVTPPFPLCICAHCDSCPPLINIIICTPSLNADPVSP